MMPSGTSYFVYIICFVILSSLAEQDGEDAVQAVKTLKNSVVEFNLETFEKEILKHHFIMFYAPWCGHCKRLHPTWNELGEKHNTEDGSITIGKVDCTQYTSVCASQEVNGYPTLKFYGKKDGSSIKYRGQRDLPSLEKFIAEQLGLEYKEEPGIPDAISGLVEFTDTSFVESVQNGNFFIKFYAPWCGHCKRLEPTWASLAASLEHDRSVVVGRLDCTKYKSVCTDFEVKGYPTLLWIENGKKVAKYSGDRSHEDLKRFVVEQLGERSEGEEVWKVLVHEVPQIVATLTAENFENGIAHGLTFVEYFAPWCGHCKRLAPTFEELGKKFLAFDGIDIAKVDCTQDINRELCSEQEVNGFPTLILYKDGEKEAEYNGDRSLDDMAEFIFSRMSHDEL